MEVDGQEGFWGRFGADRIIRRVGVHDHFVPWGIVIEGNELNHYVDAGPIKNIRYRDGTQMGILLGRPSEQPHTGKPTNCTIRTGTINLAGATYKVRFTPDVSGGQNVLYTREPATKPSDAAMLEISPGNYGHSGDNRYNSGSGWGPG